MEMHLLNIKQKLMNMYSQPPTHTRHIKLRPWRTKSSQSAQEQQESQGQTEQTQTKAEKTDQTYSYRTSPRKSASSVLNVARLDPTGIKYPLLMSIKHAGISSSYGWMATSSTIRSRIKNSLKMHTTFKVQASKLIPTTSNSQGCTYSTQSNSDPKQV